MVVVEAEREEGKGEGTAPGRVCGGGGLERRGECGRDWRRGEDADAGVAGRWENGGRTAAGWNDGGESGGRGGRVEREWGQITGDASGERVMISA